MTRPETHCKQLKSSEWASPKANSVDPKAPQPVLVPGGAAGAAADEARGRLSGQLPLGTPTLGGSSVIRKESYLGENLRKAAQASPPARRRRTRALPRAWFPEAAPPPGTPPGVGGAGLARLQFLFWTHWGARAGKEPQSVNTVIPSSVRLCNLFPSPERLMDTVCTV